MHKRNSISQKMKKARRRPGHQPAAALRRPLLSASGAVVGAGMMALAFAPSRSEAASALDAMPWLPTQVPVTQPGAFVTAAPPTVQVDGNQRNVERMPAALPSMPTGAGKVLMQNEPVGALRSDAAAVQAPAYVAPNSAASAARLGAMPESRAATSDEPVRAAGADSGLARTAPEPAVVAPQAKLKPTAVIIAPPPAPIGMATRPVSGWRLRSADIAPVRAQSADVAPPQPVVREKAHYAPDSDTRAIETMRANPPPVVPTVARAPEPLRVRAPDLHATALIALPTLAQAPASGQPPMPVLVPEPARAPANAPIPKAVLVSAAQGPISAMTTASASHANDVVLDFPGAAPQSKKHADRSARAVDEAYSQWLGDGSADVPDAATSSPVPEQVVRGALRHAAEIAADRSADVRQARADWEAAGFDTDAARGARWPQLQIGGYSPSVRDSNTQFNDYNRAYANINLSTTVYDWGKNSKTIESRSKTAAAAEFKYIATAQQNAFDVSSNLVELAKNRAAFEFGVTYVKRMRALVDMLVEIVKVDPGRSSELTQAKARLLQAQTSQDQVATRMRELELAVKKLVGDEAVSMPRSTRWQMHVMNVEDAVAAIDQNPAVAQAAAEQEANQAYAKAVRASGLPQVNWVVTKSTGRDEFGQRQPWSTMLQLSWTPFSGGTQTANERAARARATSSGEKKDQLRLDAEYNVRQAHHDALALTDRARLYDEVTNESELVRKQFFEQWYHLNRRTLLDVLLAESDFYNNRVAEVTTQFDAYQAVLKMRLSSGTLLQWLQQG